MKVQTRGLLADLSTMKPPGPFSPLRREALVGDLEPGKTPDPRSAPTHLGLGWEQEGSCWSKQGPNGCPRRHRIQPPTPPAVGCSNPPPTACRCLHSPRGRARTTFQPSSSLSRDACSAGVSTSPRAQLWEQCRAARLHEGAPSWEASGLSNRIHIPSAAPPPQIRELASGGETSLPITQQTPWWW